MLFVQAVFDGSSVDGLWGANSTAVSPDGKHVYATGSQDNAVAIFARNEATGGLTYVGVVKDLVGGVEGLLAPVYVTVSPDGNHVYAAGFSSDAIAVFARNSDTGALAFVQRVTDGQGGVDGLDGASSVAVSPDGKHVYATGGIDDSVVALTRTPATGALTFVGTLKDGVGGVAGLDAAGSVSVSPDGKNVYTVGYADDAISVFDRDSVTGALTYVEALTNGSGVQGLDYALSATVSPDGLNVYTAGYDDDAVAVFSRNGDDGRLTFVEVHSDGVNGVDGLYKATSVAVSPDGQHVYGIGHWDEAVAVFTRNRVTGELTFQEVRKQGVGGIVGMDGAKFVTVSPDGDHLYVASVSDNAVAVFESLGPASQATPPPFIAAWGSLGSAPGEFRLPVGLASGSLYVADYVTNRIQKFGSLGVFVTEWGSEGSANGFFRQPTDVTVSPAGEVYVVDLNNSRIQVFDTDGNYLRQWGSPGSGQGQFDVPISIAADALSNIYVVDRGNHRIQKFDRYGAYLKEWGSQGTGPGQFMLPQGVAVGPSGDVYVTDGASTPPEVHRVQCFDSTGSFLASWGAGPSSRNGRFDVPKGIAVNDVGHVFVADVGNSRIQEFDSDGRFLGAWGSPGSGNGQFSGPEDVTVDAAGRIYVADTQNHRIQVFGSLSLDFFIGDRFGPDQTLWISPPSLPEPGR